MYFVVNTIFRCTQTLSSIQLCFVLLLFAASSAGNTEPPLRDEPQRPNTPTIKNSFDYASAFEIYTFSVALQQVDFSNKKFLHDATRLDKLNHLSLLEWRDRTERRLVDNFRNACAQSLALRSKECSAIDTLAKITHYMSPFYNALGKHLDNWKVHSRTFHRNYLYEQLRLAALFPRVSSEISTFDDNEVDGFSLPDKTFLLTFDDGPSKNDTTQSVISVLEEHKVNGIFFVLGDKWQGGNIKSTTILYRNQCLGSHGYQHNAHPRMKGWRNSIDKTEQLIDSININQKRKRWFRPPYGERTPEMTTYYKNKYNGKTMLWNIDSRDWNTNLSTENITDRVERLMLLWRRGIILYHDIQTKTPASLKLLFNRRAPSEVQYLACDNI